MRSLFLSLIVLLLPAVVSAHGESPSFETTVGQYLIDIGYDREGIRPGEEVIFDFDLFSASGALSFVPFDYVDVSFSREGTEVFAERLNNNPQFIPTLPHIFTESGDYTMNVTYGSGETVIAEGSFPVPVSEQAGAAGRMANIITYITAAVLVTVALWAIVQSLRRRNQAR